MEVLTLLKNEMLKVLYPCTIMNEGILHFFTYGLSASLPVPFPPSPLHTSAELDVSCVSREKIRQRSETVHLCYFPL